jgi:hypothetical protein
MTSDAATWGANALGKAWALNEKDEAARPHAKIETIFDISFRSSDDAYLGRHLPNGYDVLTAMRIRQLREERRTPTGEPATSAARIGAPEGDISLPRTVSGGSVTQFDKRWHPSVGIFIKSSLHS